MTNSLGIYFGPKVINIVETKGKKALNNIQIPRSALSAAELEEKVPEEVKLVALFKDELVKNKIDAKEATLSLSGKDLIIRTFEMPVLPASELPSAVNFEAKKYIPFKVEDLISGFQSQFDKPNSRNLILFVGAKKETLDKYISILHELAIKVNSIEYSAFSVLRFLKLTGLGDKGVIGIISADFRDEGEVNFTVLQNGFPLFSRDITLSSVPEEFARTEEPEPEVMLEKLKTEIRISLDYYHRKLPNKEIEKTLLICEGDYRSDLETFIKELGFPSQFVEVTRYNIGEPHTFSLSFIKGYGCSLSKIIKTSLKIKLLTAEVKVRPFKETAIIPEEIPMLAGLRLEPRVVILALLICVASFLLGFYRKFPLQKELDNIKLRRPVTTTVKDPEASYKELTDINSEYKKRIDIMGKLINKELYLTEVFDAIPRLLPENMWLINFSFRKEIGTIELLLNGVTYLADSQKEIELVHAFLSKLKANPLFTKYFKDIAINSISQSQTEKVTATSFIISCRSHYQESK